MVDVSKWAKREAARRRPADGDWQWRVGLEDGAQALAALLLSDEAVEAAAKALYIDHATDGIGGSAPQIAEACERMARAALVAAVSAVTTTNTTTETGEQ